MTTVSAFSPLSFYARANGTPLTSDEISEIHSLALPTASGVTLARSDESSAPRAILAALYAQTAERNGLLESIKRGEVPTITPSPLSTELPILRLYPPLGELHESSMLLVEFLGLVPPLAEKARENSRRSCPMCGTPTIQSRFAADLAKDAISRWKDERAIIEVNAPHENLAPWAETRGFLHQKTDAIHSSSRLDSFPCTEEEFERRHALLSSALHIPQSSIQIRCKESTLNYARGGWCSTCRAPLTITSLREIKECLARGKGDALSCMLGDITLAQALKTDIQSLVATSGFQECVPSQLVTALQGLGLDSLSLGRSLHSLSPQGLSALTLITTLSTTAPANTCSIIDIPLSLFSENESQKHIHTSQNLSGDATVLWISDNPSTTNKATHATKTPHPTKILGELSFTGSFEARFEIVVDGSITIPRTQDASHQRLALAVTQAVQGQSSPLVSFHSHGQFSAKFVECFSPAPSYHRLVAHDLGAIEPLAKLFAASHQAKMLGLSPKDFIVGQAKAGKHVCPACRGAGTIVSKSAPLSPLGVTPCSRCWGTRFRSPVKEITFKGKTLWETLNLSIAETAPTLKALPRMSHVLEAAKLLSLSSIPLGMPVAALSNEQQRNLSILRAMLIGTTTTPVVIVLEEPFVRLSTQQQNSLVKVFTLAGFKGKVSWLLV